jgi:hypothetical protein
MYYGGFGMKRLGLRKAAGAAMIAVGAYMVFHYVPLWVWYAIMVILVVAFVYTLIRLYL